MSLQSKSDYYNVEGHKARPSCGTGKWKREISNLRKEDADKILEIHKGKFKINKAMELSDPPLTCCSNQLKNNPRRQAVLNTHLMQELKKLKWSKTTRLRVLEVLWISSMNYPEDTKKE